MQIVFDQTYPTPRENPWLRRVSTRPLYCISRVQQVQAARLFEVCVCLPAGLSRSNHAPRLVLTVSCVQNPRAYKNCPMLKRVTHLVQHARFREVNYDLCSDFGICYPIVEDTYPSEGDGIAWRRQCSSIDFLSEDTLATLKRLSSEDNANCTKRRGEMHVPCKCGTCFIREHWTKARTAMGTWAQVTGLRAFSFSVLQPAAFSARCLRPF